MTEYNPNRKKYSRGESHYLGQRDCCAKGHPYEPDNVYYQPRAHGTKVRSCKKCRAKYTRDYRLKNLKKFSERESRYAKRKKAKWRATLFEAYGQICACCGETHEAFLTLDHKNNDGAAHRKIVKPDRIYREVIKQGCPKDKYQILCMNCNWARRFGKTCPHELERDTKMRAIELEFIEEFSNG